MFAKLGEEEALLAVRRHLRKSIKAEVSPLELALAQVAPFGKGNGLAVMREHRQRVAMQEFLRQDIESGPMEIIPLVQIQVLGEGLKHIRAALSDIVCQDFNLLGPHHCQQGEVPPLKVGLAELGLYGSQFALQDGNKKIPASARRLQETRVYALGLALHQVKHVFDQPLRREHLAVVCNAPFGLDQIHG